MIGIDMVKVADVAKKSDAFFRGAFTESEREYIESKRNGAETAAGIFAAKEAVLKALGCGLSGGIRNVEILHGESGAPFARLAGKAEELLAGRKLFVSISHTDGTAVAAAYIC